MRMSKIEISRQQLGALENRDKKDMQLEDELICKFILIARVKLNCPPCIAHTLAQRNGISASTYFSRISLRNLLPRTITLSPFQETTLRFYIRPRVKNILGTLFQ